MLTIMRKDRSVWLAEDSAIVREMLAHFFFVAASDGVFVPRCDLSQYDAGERPWA